MDMCKLGTFIIISIGLIGAIASLVIFVVMKGC